MPFIIVQYEINEVCGKDVFSDIEIMKNNLDRVYQFNTQIEADSWLENNCERGIVYTIVEL